MFTISRVQTLRCSDFIAKEPMIIGHECAGIIEEIGSEVNHLLPGDRVAIEPGISCWLYDLCKDGRYNLCPDMKFFATPPVHGSLANQIVHHADLCFGAPRIVIVDVDDHSLSVAKSLGVKVSSKIEDVSEVVQIHKAMGAGVDVSFDCAGFNKTMTTALNATPAGGKVCLTVPLKPAAAWEVDVIGIFRYKNTWPLCLEFLRSGKIDVKPLTTQVWVLSEGG